MRKPMNRIFGGVPVYISCKQSRCGQFDHREHNVAVGTLWRTVVSMGSKTVVVSRMILAGLPWLYWVVLGHNVPIDTNSRSMTGKQYLTQEPGITWVC